MVWVEATGLREPFPPVKRLLLPLSSPLLSWSKKVPFGFVPSHFTQCLAFHPMFSASLVPLRSFSICSGELTLKSEQPLT